MRNLSLKHPLKEETMADRCDHCLVRMDGMEVHADDCPVRGPEIIEESENLKLENADLCRKVQALELEKEKAEKKGRDLCCAFGNLLLAVTAMIKHQEDRHELGSCCKDVTPTPAYLLKEALNDLNKVTLAR